MRARQGEIQEDPSPPKRRLPAYRGVAREIGWAAFNLALWPVGVVDQAVRDSASKWNAPAIFRRPKPSTAAAEIPIVLIHGYFHNRSGMLVMMRALRKRGFREVHAFNYNPLRKNIPQIAECVRDKVERTMEKTGASKVHLIGHSLGGILARYYVEAMGGARNVHTLVTLGTPHHGTLVAYAGRSPAARELRPGSSFMKQLEARKKPRGVRYVSYHSNMDALVIPSRSAILENGNGSSVRNFLVRDLGHLSLLISPELVASIADLLSEVQ